MVGDFAAPPHCSILNVLSDDTSRIVTSRFSAPRRRFEGAVSIVPNERELYTRCIEERSHVKSLAQYRDTKILSCSEIFSSSNNCLPPFDNQVLLRVNKHARRPFESKSASTKTFAKFHSISVFLLSYRRINFV